MAKNSIRDYSATNSSNTDIQSIDISEGCSPAGINNAIREIMADLKDVSTGAVALETPQADGLTIGTSNLDMNGNEVILDADADTSITADTDDQIDFKVGGADQIALTDGVLAPSTDDDVDLGSTTKRFNDLFLGGGLYIGGTGSANYLQDYETGTWTGSIEGSATNPTTAVTATGVYVKVGSVVHINIQFSDFATTGASGLIKISGLPFTTNDTYNNGNAMFHNVALNTSASNISPYLNPVTTEVEFYQSLNTSGWAGVTHHVGGGNRYIWMGLTYGTDA